ncbi:Fc.00g082170.m01.CDS01 [Cosmosporella sp. VM-42]
MTTPLCEEPESQRNNLQRCGSSEQDGRPRRPLSPGPVTKLAHFIPNCSRDPLPRITGETLAKALSGSYGPPSESCIIIDCRFNYEYNAGHIDGAVNFADGRCLDHWLFRDPFPGGRALIFYCEYSIVRGPTLASYVRSRDRDRNMESYPKLTFPDIYVLEGGFSGFFGQYPDQCKPRGYVSMSDPAHQEACRRGMAELRQHQPGSRNRPKTGAPKLDINEAQTPIKISKVLAYTMNKKKPVLSQNGDCSGRI